MSRPQNPPLAVPQPRRPGTFSLTPISTDAHSDVSPSDGPSEPSTPDVRDSRSDGAASLSREPSRDSSEPPKKSRSILNLTSSTLFGIYNHSGFDSNRDEPPTPYGTGSLTPALGNGGYNSSRRTSVELRGGPTRNTGPVFSEELLREKAAISKERRRERRKSELQHHDAVWRRRSATARSLTVFLRVALLFSFGAAYGALIAHLHDKENIAPVRVERINRRSWLYTAFWGIMGVILGSLMPWVDESSAMDDDDEADLHDQKPSSRHSLGADWNPIVRSIGAFVGIAFAIRKLTWQSTLQVSLTLALVNPFLWYLIDRTRNGFAIATITGIAGAAVLLSINPEWVPSPTMPASSVPSGVWDTIQGIAKPGAGDSISSPSPGSDLMLSLVSYESVGVATWISSVFFCSSIFFGNIGRRLSSGPL